MQIRNQGLAHVHDVGAAVEDADVGLEDVEVEGGCQQAPVPGPFVPTTQQQPIPCAGHSAPFMGAPMGAASPSPGTHSPSQGLRNP